MARQQRALARGAIARTIIHKEGSIAFLNNTKRCGVKEKARFRGIAEILLLFYSYSMLLLLLPGTP